MGELFAIRAGSVYLLAPRQHVLLPELTCQCCTSPPSMTRARVLEACGATICQASLAGQLRTLQSLCIDSQVLCVKGARQLQQCACYGSLLAACLHSITGPQPRIYPPHLLDVVMKMTQADNATGTGCIDVHHFVNNMHKSPSAASERHLTTPFQALKSTSCHERCVHTVDYEAHTIAHAPTHCCQEKTVTAHWAWPLKKDDTGKLVRVNISTYSQTSAVN